MNKLPAAHFPFEVSALAGVVQPEKWNAGGRGERRGSAFAATKKAWKEILFSPRFLALAKLSFTLLSLLVSHRLLRL